MLSLLKIAALLAVIDATFAVVAWHALARPLKRSSRLRTGAALGGAIAGALLAWPQVELLVLWLGYLQEAAGLTIAFSFPLSLPVTTALAAWLSSEIAAGRSARPALAALVAISAAVLGALLVFVPLLLSKSFDNALESALEVFGPAAKIVGFISVLAPPVAGAVLGLRAVQRRAVAPVQTP
jgi:hypothetical protein